MAELYDSRARRQVYDSELPRYYEQNRERYLRVGRALYNTLLSQASEELMPLRADVQILLTDFLQADQQFLNDLPDLINDKRSVRRFPALFAGYIVDRDWNLITSTGEGGDYGPGF